MQEVTTKSGKKWYLPSLSECQRAANDNTGFCIACGNEQIQVEPDAERYECDECSESRVYGPYAFFERGWTRG